MVLIPQADRGLVQLPNPPSLIDGGGSTDQCQYVEGEQTALNEIYIAYLNQVNAGTAYVLVNR